MSLNHLKVERETIFFFGLIKKTTADSIHYYFFPQKKDMTIKAHNKTTYTITPVNAGCKESSSWSEEGTHIGNKKIKKTKTRMNKTNRHGKQKMMTITTLAKRQRL